MGNNCKIKNIKTIIINGESPTDEQKIADASLLFLIYINDLPKVSNKLLSVLYADDTCMSLSNKK